MTNLEAISAFVKVCVARLLSDFPKSNTNQNFWILLVAAFCGFLRRQIPWRKSFGIVQLSSHRIRHQNCSSKVLLVLDIFVAGSLTVTGPG